MLVLEPGYKLKSAQVKAIKNLVAYSVPRMTPEQVLLQTKMATACLMKLRKTLQIWKVSKQTLKNKHLKKFQMF